MQLGEVGDVLGDQRPALGGCMRQQWGIGQSVEVGVCTGSDDVMTPAAQLGSDGGGEVLVEQEPHPKTARSRRAASSSRAAASAWRTSMSSISAGKAA